MRGKGEFPAIMGRNPAGASRPARFSRAARSDCLAWRGIVRRTILPG